MAENRPGLTGLGVVAILAVSAALMDAQAKQPSAETLKTEARNFGKIIGGDKRKSQTYCKIVEINEQIDEKEDPREARKLTQKRDKLGKKLGLMRIDRSSRDYQQIASILEPLHKSCEDRSSAHK